MSKKKRARMLMTDLRKRFARRRSKGEMVDKQRDLFRSTRPPDVASIRAC